MNNKGNPIELQITMRGRGLDRLTHDMLTDLALETVNGIEPPEGVRVEIIAWRSGIELDWRNKHNEWLRNIIRSHLQHRDVALQVRHR